MTIERTIWIPPFIKESFPSWPCAICNNGALSLDNDAFHEQESTESTKNRDNQDWEPEWIHGLFSTYLNCSNQACREKSVVCGSYRVASYIDQDTGAPYAVEVYQPDFIKPAPDLFPIPDNCPDNIKRDMRTAFSLYWSDLDATGNRLRTAVESLLSYLKVRKRVKKANGKYHYLSLHDRILEYHPRNPDVGEKLLAIKWLGNIGSHGNGLSNEDLIDDFEMIQYAFDELFEKDRERLSRMAKEIIKRKGRIRT